MKENLHGFRPPNPWIVGGDVRMWKRVYDSCMDGYTCSHAAGEDFDRTSCWIFFEKDVPLVEVVLFVVDLGFM